MKKYHVGFRPFMAAVSFGLSFCQMGLAATPSSGSSSSNSGSSNSVKILKIECNSNFKKVSDQIKKGMSDYVNAKIDHYYLGEDVDPKNLSADELLNDKANNPTGSSRFNNPLDSTSQNLDSQNNQNDGPRKLRVKPYGPVCNLSEGQGLFEGNVPQSMTPESATSGPRIPLSKIQFNDGLFFYDLNKNTVDGKISSDESSRFNDGTYKFQAVKRGPIGLSCGFDPYVHVDSYGSVSGLNGRNVSGVLIDFKTPTSEDDLSIAARKNARNFGERENAYRRGAWVQMIKYHQSLVAAEIDRGQITITPTNNVCGAMAEQALKTLSDISSAISQTSSASPSATASGSPNSSSCKLPDPTDSIEECKKSANGGISACYKATVLLGAYQAFSDVGICETFARAQFDYNEFLTKSLDSFIPFKDGTPSSGSDQVRKNAFYQNVYYNCYDKADSCFGNSGANIALSVLSFGTHSSVNFQSGIGLGDWRVRCWEDSFRACYKMAVSQYYRFLIESTSTGSRTSSEYNDYSSSGKALEPAAKPFADLRKGTGGFANRPEIDIRMYCLGPDNLPITDPNKAQCCPKGNSTDEANPGPRKRIAGEIDEETMDQECPQSFNPMPDIITNFTNNKVATEGNLKSFNSLVGTSGATGNDNNTPGPAPSAIGVAGLSDSSAFSQGQTGAATAGLGGLLRGSGGAPKAGGPAGAALSGNGGGSGGGPSGNSGAASGGGILGFGSDGTQAAALGANGGLNPGKGQELASVSGSGGSGGGRGFGGGGSDGGDVSISASEAANMDFDQLLSKVPASMSLFQIVEKKYHDKTKSLMP